MARSLTDFIRSIFESDDVTVTESGQRTISLDHILPQTEGIQLIDPADVTGSDTETEVETVEDVVTYASADELNKVIERLIALESLIRSEETLDNNIEVPVYEEW